jgi:uncharacterized membrane protein
VLTVPVSDRRLLERAFEKVRQASGGMPAVMIRQLDALAQVAAYATTTDQREVIVKQAEMILRLSRATVTEEQDLADVARRYDAVVSMGAGTSRAAPRPG